MKLTSFICGLCVGVVAGATVDRMSSDRKARRAVKTPWSGWEKPWTAHLKM